MPRVIWRKVLFENGLSEEQLCHRYDLVLHLVTAADGAESHYKTDGRHHSAKEAKALDAAIKEAYALHPNFQVSTTRPTLQASPKNLTSEGRIFLADAHVRLAGKMDRATAHVLRVSGAKD